MQELHLLAYPLLLPPPATSLTSRKNVFSLLCNDCRYMLMKENWSICQSQKAFRKVRSRWHWGYRNTGFIVLLKLFGALSYTDKRERKFKYLLQWLPEEGGRESPGGNAANLWEKLCKQSCLAAAAWWSAAAVSLVSELCAAEPLKLAFVRMESK